MKLQATSKQDNVGTRVAYYFQTKVEASGFRVQGL